jgi:hypothetical protein
MGPTSIAGASSVYAAAPITPAASIVSVSMTVTSIRTRKQMRVLEAFSERHAKLALCFMRSCALHDGGQGERNPASNGGNCPSQTINRTESVSARHYPNPGED